MMQCERSGEYKPPKTRKKLNLKGISSRKCQCPFRLQGFFDCDTNDWWIAMLCGMHNHDLEEKLQGHLLAGRLNAEEKKKVIDMTKSLTVPQNILTKLKQNNKESVTTIKQVYNVRTRWRKGQRGDMRELQFLMLKLEEHQYIYYTRCNSKETKLRDIFFAHPTSIKFLNTFPTFLVMDSTYKTNTYQMSLFEIVGCTYTKMTYSVGCVQKTSYRLPCTCILSMKSKQKMALVLDNIYPHWKTLSVQGEEVHDDFFVMEEWNDIQELLKKCPYKMKLYSKEMMRKLAFPKDTNLSPPPKKVVTKGTPTRKRSTLKLSSMGRIPSRW